jgi:hypothetical protein
MARAGNRNKGLRHRGEGEKPLSKCDRIGFVGVAVNHQDRRLRLADFEVLQFLSVARCYPKRAALWQFRRLRCFDNGAGDEDQLALVEVELG